MTTALLILVLAMTAHAREAVQPDCDLSRLLAAIEAKEQGGEGNAYGLTKITWTQHMEGTDYALCGKDPHLTKLCALKHLAWLANECAKAGIHPGVYELASAWNLGKDGFVKLHRMHVEVQYGRDVENLYGEIK